MNTYEVKFEWDKNSKKISAENHYQAYQKFLENCDKSCQDKIEVFMPKQDGNSYFANTKIYSPPHTQKSDNNQPKKSIPEKLSDSIKKVAESKDEEEKPAPEDNKILLSLLETQKKTNKYLLAILIFCLGITFLIILNQIFHDHWLFPRLRPVYDGGLKPQW